ncbi:MAG: sterol desaturase family protein [Deltaproteobacteria bacterium]|nr:sterol desaturase family protein [Deltaproteobacteria bacterium]
MTTALPARAPAWRRTLEVATYPAALLASLVACWALLRAGLAPGLAVGPVVFATALLLWGMESLNPHAAAWVPDRRTLRLDVTHSLLSANGTAILLKATLLAALATAGARIAQATGGALWPSGWPLPLQLALAVVIGDFGAYWAHRAMHLTRLGWRIHAVHHTPTRLHVMAAGRTHPLNAAFTLTCEGLVVALMGAGPAVIALWTVTKAVNGLLQHANLELRPGPLSYVLATSDNHRWHHSRDLAESNTNFGNTTMLWDQVFGTFFHPRDRAPGLELGIADSTIPESYLAHLAAPFALGRWERDSG